MAVKFINSCTPYIKQRRQPPQNYREDDWLQGIIGVSRNQCMRLVSGVSCQKFGQVGNNHVIDMTLNWAKKVMVKVWDVDGLVDNQVERPPGLWIIIGYFSFRQVSTNNYFASSRTTVYMTST